MDRVISYPGVVPAVEDFLQAQKDAMFGIGFAADAVMGPGVAAAAGLAASVDGSNNLTIGPGSLTAPVVADAAAFGILGADQTRITMQGINTAPFTLALGSVAPGAGQSVIVLILAAVSVTDGSAIVLPYYNTNSPATPYNGPAGNGIAQPTRRSIGVALTYVSGPPGAPGSATAPAIPAGTFPLYTVVITSGAATSIALHPASPLLPWTLPQLAPGCSRGLGFTSSTFWGVPWGVHRARIRPAGGGGGGGWGGGGGGGGGAGGGWSDGFYALTPGDLLTITVGAGGIGGTSSGYGQAGGATTVSSAAFGVLCGATGGGAGSAGSPSGLGPGSLAPGQGSGTTGVFDEPYGSSGGNGAGSTGLCFGGGGGGACGFDGGQPQPLAAGSNAVGNSGQIASGGGGGVGTGNGGAGGNGRVIIEF